MAISALTVFEIRSTGVDTNSGGFVTGSTGTDYSQQDAAQFTFDGVTNTLSNGAVSATLTVTGPTVDGTWVGNTLQVTGGTNLIVGVYQILSTNTGTITLDRAATSAAGSGGRGAIGGAMASVGKACSASVAGNKFYLKAGTYTLTSASSNVAAGCFTLPAVAGTTNIASLIGYDLVRGDFTGNRPILKADGVITSFTICTTGSSNYIDNVEFDGNLRTTSRGMTTTTSASQVTRCVFRNFTNSGLSAGNNSTRVIFCRFTGCTTTVAFSGGLPSFCVFDNNAILGCNPAAGIIVGCSFLSNTGASTDGFVGNGNICINCTSAFNGRNNFSGLNQQFNMFVNCISWAPGAGDGFTISVAVDTPTLFFCLSGGATSGANFNANYTSRAKVSCQTITGNPFLDSTNGNFAPSTTADGLLARALSMLGPMPGTNVSRLDIGAWQHLDPTQPSAANVKSGVIYNDGATTGTLTLPTASHLLTGDVVGVGGTSVTGTLTLPTASHVLNDQTYGVGGNGSTGTLTLPVVGKVLTATSYGIAGNGLTGTLTLPIAGHLLSGDTVGVGGTSVAGTLTLPAANHLLTGDVVGAGGTSVTGSLTLPTASHVLNDQTYGVGGNGSTGTLTLPAAANVLTPTSYGIAGNGLTGTLTLPTASHLLTGDVVGVGGTSVAGTLTLPTASHVLNDQTYGVAGNGSTGTLTLPAAGLVFLATSYGIAGNGLTGTLTLPTAGHLLTGDTVGIGGTSVAGSLTLPTVSHVLNDQIYGVAGTGSTGTLTLPTAGHVFTDQTYGIGGNGTTGTATLPSSTHVLNDQTYGVAGNGTTGTATLPTASHVLSDQTYGVGGNGTTGTATLPTASHVLSDQTYGIGGNGTTGTATLPAANFVLIGVDYGVGGSGDAGALTLPGAGNVRLGVSYGVGGNGSTGTYIIDVPAASDVRSGVSYDNLSLTGTLVLPTVHEVVLGTTFGDSAEFIGDVLLPDVGDVRNGVAYGSLSASVGTLSINSSEAPNTELYGRLANLAKRLIEKNGRAMTLLKRAETADNTNKPWRANDGADDVRTDCVGLFTQNEFGTSVKTDSRRGVEYVIVAALSVDDADLTGYDRITDGTNTWSIEIVKRIAPGTRDLLWKMEVRK